MPALLKGLFEQIWDFEFCGIGPIRGSLIGSVGVASTGHHERWIARIRRRARSAR